MFVDFNRIFKDYDNYNPPKETIPQKEIIECCHGCLCYACSNRNLLINKEFNDTVLCYQEHGKCVKIEVI